MSAGLRAHTELFRGLTRVQNLLLRYGDRLPRMSVAVHESGSVDLQFTGYGAATDDERRAAVDLLAAEYCRSEPEFWPEIQHYRVTGDKITVFTRMYGHRCETCSKPFERYADEAMQVANDATNPDSPGYDAVAEFDANVAKKGEGK